MRRSAKLVSDISRKLTRITDFVFHINFVFLFIVLFGFSILQNGLYWSPAAERIIKVSQNITANPFTDQVHNQWLLASFLGPLLAHLTSFNNNIMEFAVFHLFVLSIFLLPTLMVLRNKRGDFVARTMLIGLFLTPLPNILLTWLGQPDVFTILFIILLVINRDNLLLTPLIYFLMGVNHIEQGIVILAFMVLFFVFARDEFEIKSAIKYAFVGFIGLALGRASLQVYFQHYNFDIQFSRVDHFFNTKIDRYVMTALSDIYALPYSLYNVFILFVVSFVAYFRTRRITKIFIICNVIALAIALGNFDHTRDFAIMTLPCVALLISSKSFLTLDETEKSFFKRVLTISLIIGLIVPRIVMWEGRIYSSALHQLIFP